MRSAKVTVICSVLAGVVLATSIGGTVGYFYVKNLKEKHEEELAVAKATIDRLGPLTDICVLSPDVEKAEAGQEITEEMVETAKLPKSMINDDVIQDPSEIIGKYFKIDMKPSLYFTNDMVMQDEIDDSTRDIDIVIDYYPTGLKVGDYVDVRLVLPKGEDYITLSHKRVMAMNGDTIKVIVNEREILFYSSALVDKFINQGAGSAIYLTKYTDPGLQKPAEITYNIPDNILTVLTANPNVIDKIINGGLSREFIETQFKNIAQEDESVLSSGRATYQSKLEQARTFYTSKQEEQASMEGEDDVELTDADDDISTDKESAKDKSKEETVPKTE